MSKRRSSLVVVLLAVASIVSSGCESDKISGIVAEANKTEIQKLGNGYMLFQARMGKAAKSKDELVDFIKTNDRIEKNLKFMGITRDGFEDLFNSQSDGEEFFVRWNVFVPDRAPAEPIVFETTGAEGVRRVMWSSGEVKEYEDIDDAEYANLKKGKFRRERFKGPDLSNEGQAKAEE